MKAIDHFEFRSITGQTPQAWDVLSISTLESVCASRYSPAREAEPRPGSSPLSNNDLSALPISDLYYPPHRLTCSLATRSWLPSPSQHDRGTESFATLPRAVTPPLLIMIIADTLGPHKQSPPNPRPRDRHSLLGALAPASSLFIISAWWAARACMGFLRHGRDPHGMVRHVRRPSIARASSYWRQGRCLGGATGMGNAPAGRLDAVGWVGCGGCGD